MTEAVWQIYDPVFEAEQACPAMASYPWSGHRRFAYDLMRFVRPARLVELGAHVGTSFFAFCQAVKDGRLGTQCIAIDTWQGDEHSGAYDQDVYESVREIASRCFGDVDIVLLKMLFSEARGQVEDESVEVLHIDGLHTYEAVSEDFNSWLGKLKPHGVILLHDVAESTGYGSARFWGEIRERYRSFEFPHSWGLGVCFPKGERLYQALLKENIGDKCRVYEYRAELELARIKLHDVTGQLLEREQAMQRQAGMIDERDALIGRQEEMVRDRDQTIRSQGQLVDERDAAIAHQSIMIDERDAAIAHQSQMIDERDAYLRRLEGQVRQQAATIEGLESRVGALERNLRAPGFCFKAGLRALWAGVANRAGGRP